MTLTDSECLRRFAEHRSNEAFSCLVERHLPLVYGVAVRRLNGDAHTAVEVCQEVFDAMGRHARPLIDHPAPAAWLHRVAVRRAANAARSRQRTHARVMPLADVDTSLTPSDHPEPEWERARPLIDAAIDRLAEADRRVLVQRFFVGAGYAEIGRQLRISEDSARMRVQRALSRLRRHFQQKGILSAAAALETALLAFGRSAAPTGLAAQIAAPLPAVGIAAVVAAVGAWLTVPKALVVSSLALLGATAWTRLSPTRPPAEPPTITVDVAAVVAPSPAPTVTFPAPTIAPDDFGPRLPGIAEADEKVATLREVLARLPHLGIPEMALLTVGDWYLAADGPLETAADYQRAFSHLRTRAEERFAQAVLPALQAYGQTHDQQPPPTLAALTAQLPATITPAMLDRWAILPPWWVGNMTMGEQWMVTQTGLVDNVLDSPRVIGSRGMGSTNGNTAANAARQTLLPVLQRYTQATGRTLPQPADLEPYATTEAEKAALRLTSRRLQRPTARP